MFHADIKNAQKYSQDFLIKKLLHVHETFGSKNSCNQLKKIEITA